MRTSGNTSAKGRAGRDASPWSAGPMCDTSRAKRSFADFQNAGKQPTRNVLTHGYEAVAEFIASRITRDKAGYAVHISDKGVVYLTRKDRQRANELPEDWKLGEYPYTGLRVEFIEEDLLDWQRSRASGDCGHG